MIKKLPHFYQMSNIQQFWKQQLNVVLESPKEINDTKKLKSES